MDNLRLDQLQQLLPTNSQCEHWYNALATLLPDYQIDTSLRIAAFIAQCSHESNGFMVLKENLNYSAPSLLKLFPRYFDSATAIHYCEQPNKQEVIANRIYANRMGNSNEASGDGFRYCGRGLIQITGKDNYQSFADSIEITAEAVPDYLATFEGAVQSACWFWESNNLNQYADSGDIVTLTKRINGGTNGLDDRTVRYQHALQVLGT